MVAHLDLRLMHYVLCLAEEGNVTRAARRLNIVQPALSMQIAKLERSLGQKLFERGPKGMRPTAEGERFVALFAPVLREAEVGLQQMMPGERIGGRVSIGLVASIAQCTMAHSSATIANRFPDVRLCVLEGYTESLIDWVAGGQLQMAIVNVPAQRPPLELTPILDEEMVLACRRGTARIPANLALEHLERFDLVMPSKRHGLRKLLDEAALAQGLELKPRLELDSVAALCEVISSTDFVTVLPSVAVHKEILAGRAEAYRFEAQRLVRSVGAVHHPRRPLSSAGRAILEVMRADIVAAAQTAAEFIRPSSEGRGRKRKRRLPNEARTSRL